MMFKIIERLWSDDTGAILSMEILLIATVLLIGVIAGLATFRDAVITEMADMGASLSNLDQSYVLHGATSGSAATAASIFTDVRDFGDVAGDPVLVNERCLVICASLPVVAPIGNEGVTVMTP